MYEFLLQGIRTYDYILAMKEEINQSMEMDPFNDDSDFSSDESSSDFDSPEKPSFVSRFICRGGHGGIQVKFMCITACLKLLLRIDFRGIQVC